MADTLNKRWAEDKSKFGYQMLQKFGWREGRGLGKNEDGMVNNIKVQKRVETLGIGMEHDAVGNKAFVGQINSFNDILAQLNQTHKRQHGTKRTREGEAIASSDEEDMTDDKTDDKSSEKSEEKRKETKEKSRKKSKKEDKKEKKRSKKEKKREGKKEDSMVEKRKAHAKLVRAKDVSRYSQNDLNAILGVAAHVRDVFNATQAS